MLRRFVLPTGRFALRPAIGNPVSWDRQRLQVDNPPNRGLSSGACRLGLAGQFVRSLLIASREVKRNKADDGRASGDIARLARRLNAIFRRRYYCLSASAFPF
jgi:hypothetical protein